MAPLRPSIQPFLAEMLETGCLACIERGSGSGGAAAGPSRSSLAEARRTARGSAFATVRAGASADTRLWLASLPPASEGEWSRPDSNREPRVYESENVGADRTGLDVTKTPWNGPKSVPGLIFAPNARELSRTDSHLVAHGKWHKYGTSFRPPHDRDWRRSLKDRKTDSCRRRARARARSSTVRAEVS